MADPTPVEDLLLASYAAIRQAGTRFPIERTGPRAPISDLVRILVLKRDQFRCDWCGTNHPGQLFNLDHIVPWSAGGEDDSTDASYTRRMSCTPACMPCIGYHDVVESDFDPDERQRVFCGYCNRVSWVATGYHWGCTIC